VRGCITLLGLLLAWQALVWSTGVPPYLLPAPGQVAITAWEAAPRLLAHGLVTATEIVLGFLLGGVLGLATALLLARFRLARRWLLPLLVLSQALPVFALAPLLVLWLGYGLASKVAMAVLIIFFPVTAAGYDGLRRTEPGWLDLAHTLGASRWTILWQLRLPAALPALASGLRIAAAVAPIGAVVGEWVGASRGLGFLMLQANGRMQVDLMFAALALLSLIALGFYFGVDRLLRRLVYWQPETLTSGGDRHDDNAF